jgi:hypothetical protein
MFSELVQRFDWNEDEVQDALFVVETDVDLEIFQQIWNKYEHRSRMTFDEEDVQLAEEFIAYMSLEKFAHDTVWFSNVRVYDAWVVISAVEEIRSTGLANIDELKFIEMG